MKKLSLISSVKPRTYQESLFASSINKNTLIILPTGLGKTLVSIMLSIYYFNLSNKKILFLAPTKPLVEQQKSSYQKMIENSEALNFKVLTGEVSPVKRTEEYLENDFIFSTPQLIENDIINGKLDISQFGLLILDEAHRTTGSYAYTFIGKEFSNKKVPILAMTASPGTSKEEIKQILVHLNINNIQVRTNESSDVQEYINKTSIIPIEVELDPKIKEVVELFEICFNKKLSQLQNLGFLRGKSRKVITRTDLLLLQKELRIEVSQKNSSEVIWKAISLSSGLMKLQHGIELLQSQDYSSSHNYFYNMVRQGGDNSKAAEDLRSTLSFREAYEKLSSLVKLNIKHPKLSKVKEIIISELNKKPETKFIVFSQYRDSGRILVDTLNSIKEINSVLFIGQAKKDDLKLSQKEQKKVIEDFRQGEYNVLVSTSVGEEGLDIPKVDVVLFYEPIPSAIRTIQRIGRTGRFDTGKVYVLKTKDTREIVMSYVASAKEKRMYKAIEEIQAEMKDKKNSLENFFTIKESHAETDKRYSLIIDNRENSDLIKELYSFPEIKIETQNLQVGDIILSEHIAIERKSKTDFVNSILDKRLFTQLMDLNRNYRRPLLIIEGEENIFSIRNVNPNVIRSSLSAISIDMRIPILYTSSIYETAEMIRVILKRLYRDKKEIQINAQKSLISEDQELLQVIGSIPKVNIITAKQLLLKFKSIKTISQLTEKDLIECPGIGRLRAKQIVEFFRREYKGLD